MTTTTSNPEMEVITISIPKKLSSWIKILKEWGLIPSRSEVLRHACIELCLKYKELMEFTDKELEEIEDKHVKKMPDKYIRIPNGDGSFDLKEVLRRLD